MASLERLECQYTVISGQPMISFFWWAEDIIGLKIQALATNPRRKFKELGDIQSLSQVKKDLDWERIKKYADLFGVWDTLKEIKSNASHD